RVDMWLQRLVGVAERRQREGGGLGEGGPAERGGAAGEGSRTSQKLKGLSAIHDILRRVPSRRAAAREGGQAFTIPPLQTDTGGGGATMQPLRRRHGRWMPAAGAAAFKCPCRLLPGGNRTGKAGA